ncbi:MAG: hypothetical protein GY929_21650 [Actinomycetia bacterium]|nr:hypothetical protein [Actinomycetes bacterium]MCP5028887.1 hypothetical protein [Actinomycetes bacterium]
MTANSDDLESTLTQLGADDGPPVDPVFANRLDTSLRTAHLEQLTQPRRRSIWAPVSAGVSAVAAIIVGVVIWSVAFTGGSATEVVMTAAADTNVVLPGEDVTAGSPGLHLPDGTRILVGPDGEAVVDGVVLGPGAEAVVNDGHLEVVDPADPALPDLAAPGPSVPSDESPPGPSTSSSAASPSEPGSTAAPFVTDASNSGGGDDSGGRSTTLPPTSTTVDERTSLGTATSLAPTTPSPSNPTTVATAPSTSTTTTPPTVTTPVTTASTIVTTTPGRPSIELTATAVPLGRVRLDWVVSGIADGAGGVDSPAGFRIEALAGDRTSTVVVIRSGAARTATIERLAERVSFRVIAIDAHGGILFTSNTVAQPAP